MSQIIDELRDFVLQNDINTISIDVFDTIVFRKVSRPIDIFSQIFENSELDGGGLCNASEFSEARHYAEKRAKASSKSNEVSLEKIYEFLPKAFENSKSLLNWELSLESKNSFIYQPIVDFIEELLLAGKSVFLISDMYLSKAQIQNALFKNDPKLCNLDLYVSSELNCNKASGLAFQYIASQRSIDKNRWLHIGDNLQADVKAPAVLGIHGKHFAPKLDFGLIKDMERQVFSAQPQFNAVRSLTALNRSSGAEQVSFEIGSIVWGPILLSFADWVINRSLAAGNSTILCLMREGNVYVPVLQQRLKQRNIDQLVVKKLFVSRKSTFWPSVDLTDPEWFNKLFYILCRRRGYSVKDFCRDFYIVPDQLLTSYQDQLLLGADSVYFGSDNLLKLLSQKARKNLSKVADYVTEQKACFLAYYQKEVRTEFSHCSIVDLGNGGTIQNQLESIFDCAAGANLLFYSSPRIYEAARPSLFSSFINAGNDQANLRCLLARSPECIEVFLVGNTGSTLGYDKNGDVKLGNTLSQNSKSVEAFLSGVEDYINLHSRIGFGEIHEQNAIAILNRYLQYPTFAEALLFTQIYHQDNFGSDQIYSVINEEQVERIKTIGLESFYLQFQKYPKLMIGKVHWPQAVISRIDEKFLFNQTGFMAIDTSQNVLSLLSVIIDKGWTHFSIYGAGIFFETLLPHLNNHNLQIDFVIDRKADVSDSYEVAGYRIVSLHEALQNGCEKIVISSLAFKDEITNNIVEQSVVNGLNSVEVLSL